MKRTARMVIRGLVVCALVCVATSVSQATTIIKLNLGGVGPDVGMGAPVPRPPGILATTDDGIAGTLGDQNTDVEYTSFLDFIPDINFNTASFSLDNLQEVGPATVFFPLVIQNFNGGVFNLYDSANNLLLSGPLTTSALTGVIGPPGTGALFTTTLGNVTAGSLLPFIAPGSVSLSMNMTNVNGGAGFAVAGGGPQLNPFLADAAINISADFSGVPEPATLTLVGLGAAVAIACGRRRRR